ncbi:MAG: hypothetical protein H6621_03745 [Halobacteriovoraceae bacterium]|nr:hypothetical protein [Halobacteriovoraceae bacterium]MCB9094161.1 hypothetical protein [Halobacteriovoraceae bacterium]
MSIKKFKIWDLENQFDESWFAGPIVFYSSDAFLSKYTKDFLSEQNAEVVGVWSEMITGQWIQEKFFELTLFQDDKIYYIYEAQNINVELWPQILSLADEKKACFLQFSKKNKLFKSLQKEIPMFEIEKHGFWEVDNLVDFFSKKLGVKSGQNLVDFFSIWSQASMYEVYEAILKLKILGLNASEMKVEDFQREFSHLSTNSFAYGGYLANKEFSLLAGEMLRLLSLGRDKEIFSLINFLKNMLLKAAQLEEGERVQNNYQRQIHKIKKTYSQKLLSVWIKHFSELEIFLKSKNFMFKRKLELLSLTK